MQERTFPRLKPTDDGSTLRRRRGLNVTLETDHQSSNRFVPVRATRRSEPRSIGVTQGKGVVDVAKVLGLQYLIILFFSSGLDDTEIIGDRLPNF